MIEQINAAIDCCNQLKVDNVKKKTKGEVWTPIECVEEMLSCLSDNTWNNPDIKFYDPCTGKGQFILCIIRRLLEHFEYQHIIENMIYSAELCEDNTADYLRFVNPDNLYRVNHYCGNSLKFDAKKHFNVADGFDRIVGNPPYSNSINKKKLENIEKIAKKKVLHPIKAIVN